MNDLKDSYNTYCQYLHSHVLEAKKSIAAQFRNVACRTESTFNNKPLKANDVALPPPFSV